MPAAVKSHIFSNAINRFVPPNTLCINFIPVIIRRIYSSRGPNSRPTKDPAPQIVINAPRKNPPRYMSIGRGSWLSAWLKWLPRGLVVADHIHPSFCFVFHCRILFTQYMFVRRLEYLERLGQHRRGHSRNRPAACIIHQFLQES